MPGPRSISPAPGWVGFDPTSGLLAGEGHIPLACTPDVGSAAPISGPLEFCKTDFSFSMTVQRIYESPRVTKPYTDEQWRQIEALGHQVDVDLQVGDVRLTMGGEPTFISLDDRNGSEWSTTAMSPAKRKLAVELLYKMRDRFSSGRAAPFRPGQVVSRRRAAPLGAGLLLAQGWRSHLGEPKSFRRRRQRLRLRRTRSAQISRSPHPPPASEFGLHHHRI